MSIDSIRSRHSLFWLVLVLGLSIAAIMGVKRYLALRHEAELQAAIRQLRSEFFAEDYEGAALEGEKLIKQFAASSELKAWYLSCLARSDERAEARKLATEVVRSHPNDPWSWFTLASVLNVENSQNSQAQALAASEKALALMPRHPDFLWLRAETLFFQGRAEEVPAFVDRHRTDLQSPAELLVVKARALEYLGTRVRPDQSKVAAAYAALEEARRIDPQNFEAYNLAGVYLTHEGLPADAIPLLERAVRLQPSSLSGHWNYWRAFNALAPTQKSAREAAVRVDVDSMLERGGSRPKTLSFIAFQYGEMGELSKQRMIGDRVLREFPNTSAAKAVLYRRIDTMARALSLHDQKSPPGPAGGPNAYLSPGEEAESESAAKAELTESFQKFLWGYIEHPRFEDEQLLGKVYTMLFASFKNDPNVEKEKLVRVVRGLTEHPWGSPGANTADGVLALVDRGVALDVAEETARQGAALVEHRLAEDKKEVKDAREYQRIYSEHTARIHDALGWVFLRQGKLVQADRELQTAFRLQPGEPRNLYHLGQLARARGDLSRAEQLFAEGAAAPSKDGALCAGGLKDVYAAGGGPAAGFVEYAARAGKMGKDLRKRRLVTGRLRDPQELPPFRLKTLDGKLVASVDLRGRVAVIDFWGVWCASCRESMPYLQKLADKYAKDPEVAVLSIDAWDPPAVAEKWIREKGYTFPVLVDDGYVGDQRVGSFPTTWLVDRRGRLCYEMHGENNTLVDEYSWLIEELKSR